jgi:hypothetical protein
MSSEIQASAVFQVNKGAFAHFKQLTQAAQDLDGYVASGGILTVADSATVIPLGDLFKPGWAYFVNLSTDTAIEVGIDASGFKPFLRIAPGQFNGPLSLGAAAPYAKADVAGAPLEFYIVERQGAYS